MSNYEKFEQILTGGHPYYALLPDGTLLENVHPSWACEGRGCPIHHPSDHSMADFPMHWRGDRKLMERICPHGVGHPDPDDLEYKRMVMSEEDAWAESVHGCDGCCR